MHSASIRPSRLDDATTIARLLLESAPYLIVNTKTVQRRMEHSSPAEHELSLVAEENGEVVAHGAASLDLEEGPGFARFNVHVDGRAQRRGIATTLHDALLEHCRAIDASTLVTRIHGAGGRAFAQHHGFIAERTAQVAYLSLTRLSEVPAPEGFRLTPLSELSDLRALYQVDSVVASDIPSEGDLRALPYDEWEQRYAWDGKLNTDCSVLAFHGRTPAGVAWLDSTADRVWSGLTGTMPQFRGSGLAKAMKAAALRLAHEQGFRHAYTANDSTNAAILAVNTRLGYTPHAEITSCVKRL